MKYYLKAFITVGVLGGDGQSADIVNGTRETASGWSHTTLLRLQSDHPQAKAREMAAARQSARKHYPLPRTRHVTRETALLRRGAALGESSELAEILPPRLGGGPKRGQSGRDSHDP